MAMMDGYMNEFVIGILISMTLGMLSYILIMELGPHMIRQRRKKESIIGILIGALVVIVAMMFD